MTAKRRDQKLLHTFRFGNNTWYTVYLDLNPHWLQTISYAVIPGPLGLRVLSTRKFDKKGYLAPAILVKFCLHNCASTGDKHVTSVSKKLSNTLLRFVQFFWNRRYEAILAPAIPKSYRGPLHTNARKFLKCHNYHENVEKKSKFSKINYVKYKIIIEA